MKHLFLVFAMAGILAACQSPEAELYPEHLETEYPIRPYGTLTDTAVLYTRYDDPGAYSHMKDVNGNYVPFAAESTGSVNINKAGTYYLTYHVRDNHSKAIVSITRTVHVVPNKAAYLNAIYNAVCHCTASTGTSVTQVSTESYIAAVSPASSNGHFELNRLKIGSSFVMPYSTALTGDSISLQYLSPDIRPDGIATGTVSASKRSFTIDTRSVQLSPKEKQGTVYTCRNVYTNASPDPEDAQK